MNNSGLIILDNYCHLTYYLSGGHMTTIIGHLVRFIGLEAKYVQRHIRLRK